MVEHLYCCHILMFHSLCNHVTFVSVLCFSCLVFFVSSLSFIYRFLCDSIATFKFTVVLPWRKTLENNVSCHYIANVLQFSSTT